MKLSPPAPLLCPSFPCLFGNWPHGGPQEQKNPLWRRYWSVPGHQHSLWGGLTAVTGGFWASHPCWADWCLCYSPNWSGDQCDLWVWVHGSRPKDISRQGSLIRLASGDLKSLMHQFLSGLDFLRASLVAQWVKHLSAMWETRGLIPGSGSSPGEGNGNPLQYSCLENSMDRGSW